MRKIVIILILSCLPITLLTNTAYIARAAAETEQWTAENWVLKNLTKYGGYQRVRDRHSKGAAVLSIRQKFLEHFDQTDYGFDGINEADIEISKSEWSRKIYAGQLSMFLIKDFDQDLVVTKQELEIFHLKKAATAIRSEMIYIAKTKDQISQILAHLVTTDLAMDANNDDQISIDEAKVFLKNHKIIKFQNLRSGSHIITMDFDRNNDNKIDRDEYLAEVNKALSIVDENKDGSISDIEFRKSDKNIRLIERKMKSKFYHRSND